jgi:hypothetical protein
MKKNTRNKIAMYKSVSDVLMANATSWEGIPAFVSKIEEFDAKVHLMEEKEQYQKTVSLGVGLVAKTGKEEGYNKLLRIAAALKAHASNTKDTKLLLEVKFLKSATLNKSHMEFLTKVDTVIDRANEHASELVNFGITLAEIESLSAYRTELDALLNSHRMATIKRKSTNEELSVLEKELDSLIKYSIDSLMIILKVSNPEFYSKYMNARMVIDYGHRSKPDAA